MDKKLWDEPADKDLDKPADAQEDDEELEYELPPLPPTLSADQAVRKSMPNGWYEFDKT